MPVHIFDFPVAAFWCTTDVFPFYVVFTHNKGWHCRPYVRLPIFVPHVCLEPQQSGKASGNAYMRQVCSLHTMFFHSTVQTWIHSPGLNMVTGRKNEIPVTRDWNVEAVHFPQLFSVVSSGVTNCPLRLGPCYITCKAATQALPCTTKLR